MTSPTPFFAALRRRPQRMQATPFQPLTLRAASFSRTAQAARRARQGGGMVLGIILGVMVGLAVALGVALYVAKVPVPFVNKNTSRTSGQDAAEAERNRNWNPNASLGARNGAAAPSRQGDSTGARGTIAPAPTPAPIPAPAEVAQREPVPAPAEVKPAQPKPVASKPAPAAEPTPPAATRTATPARSTSDDPLGDLVAARSGTAAPSPAPATDPFTYFVQAGAFRTQQDADAQRARLSLMGVEARVTEREQAGRTVYRVRVGPFQNRDAADRVKGRLDSNGFDAALVRVQR